MSPLLDHSIKKLLAPTCTDPLVVEIRSCICLNFEYNLSDRSLVCSWLRSTRLIWYNLLLTSICRDLQLHISMSSMSQLIINGHIARSNGPPEHGINGLGSVRHLAVGRKPNFECQLALHFSATLVDGSSNDVPALAWPERPEQL